MRFKTQAVKVRLKDDVFNKAGQSDRQKVRRPQHGDHDILKVLSSYFTADGSSKLTVSRKNSFEFNAQLGLFSECVVYGFLD
jgi:hypothetical protein